MSVALDRLTTPTIVCLGPGGVGKTSMSAAIGVALAHTGKRVVVLTIDPARRLADAMGLDEQLGNEPQQIKGPWSGELWASMLDPAATFEQVITEQAPTPAQAKRILTNRLFANLATSLSGTGEYMATERLHALGNDDRFDVVVVDTPPSRHAFDFLDAPGDSRGSSTTRSTVTCSHLDEVCCAVSKANQLAVRTVSRIVGADLLGEVVDFFSLFDGMDDGFRDRARLVDQHLSGVDTAYVLVASARFQAVEEAEWIANNLTKRDRSISLLLVNRVIPRHFATASVLADETVPPPVRQNLADLRRQIDDETRLSDQLGDATGGAPRCTIPQQPKAVSDLGGLLALASHLAEDQSSSA
ncbi:MAG: ArsA-related P-loop ATPase [Acidimicrobiales bacterium]